MVDWGVANNDIVSGSVQQFHFSKCQTMETLWNLWSLGEEKNKTGEIGKSRKGEIDDKNSRTNMALKDIGH